jgi:hypothetical protein
VKRCEVSARGALPGRHIHFKDWGSDGRTLAAEAAAIAARERHISWRAPSREEGTRVSAFPFEEPAILISEIDSTRLATDATPDIQGGRERGLILHKLIEEVLTGETEEAIPALTVRAAILIRSLGQPLAHDPS